MSTVETETVAPKASRWEDYIDIFFSPGELYRRRAHDSVKPALWTLLLLALVLYYAFLPVNETVLRASMTAQVERSGQDPAAIDATVGFMKYVSGIFAPIGYLISIALAAAFMWLGARFVELKLGYRQAFLIATYAGFIYLLMNLAGSVAGLLAGADLDPMRDMSFGLMRFVDADAVPKAIPALLRRTEIFFIWQTVVWAIGLRMVAGASRGQAAFAAVFAWVLFVVPGLIGALLQP